ncbi:MAG: hypothetical protein PHE24_03325 [Patescibacteria group bacterium]|nr:hypothetical protein [Patescibacteria group bacterium]
MKKRNKKIADSAPMALKILWEEGYFKNWIDRSKVEVCLSKRGNNFPEHNLRMALARANFLTPRKNGNIVEYIQKKPLVSKDIDDIESDLFDTTLIQKLGKSFEQEIADLHLNFGRSGNCTAFLLRKILEKLIYIAFAKNGLESKLEDGVGSGRLVGLGAMVDTAAREKLGGIPFLLPKTAREIRGIKFLGDTSAHNLLTDVDMKTILPQMPFIITAYKELAQRI